MIKKDTADMTGGNVVRRWLQKPAVSISLPIIALGIIVASFFFETGSGTRAVDLDWSLLDKVKFIPGWDKIHKAKVRIPVFPDTLARLDGKQVEITGFYIPMELNSTRCALSGNPTSSCFFCGKASVSTVMIVDFTHKVPNFASDDLITVRGKLKVMRAVNDFIYGLADAHFVRINK